MKFEGSFEVPATDKQVFDFITDASKMASLIKDVENMHIDDGNIRMTVRVGLSFIRGRFNLKMAVMNKIPFSHAEIAGNGSGSGSTVDFKGTCDITGNGGSSIVNWKVDLTIGGLAATMGSRMVQGASEKYITELIQTFRDAIVEGKRDG